ncbi:hypothetical protein SEUCBS140593_005487 [Sporothrix eucalyptigena]|uniref:Heterokaryon incompatibility domain-containing protein n=1 Tax=Sporothrix eucalyptigena TaxID=1812306 RepID=A0ABP0BXK5_9PEZI
MSSTPSSLVATSRANKASEYRHIPLQQQDSIRLLRLLPSTDNNAPVQCQLSEYPLQGPHDEVHLYEALSYVWGSTSNQQTIYVQSEGDAKDRFQTLLVTFNLHVALKHLRSRHIARTIWIDAVCIDQQNNAEKGQQVQMMAKVYNFADRVIVWLGDATDKGDQALIDICKAASQQHARTPIDASASSQEAIIKLLQRPWFQRIWVLQEAAAARNILIKCGPAEIDGYAFCSGLVALDPYKDLPELQNIARSVAVLISGANFRLRYKANAASHFSLQIRPLAELVDMYHTRATTEPLDRFYALFGMSTDDLGSAGLFVDYSVAWRDVFERVVRLATSDQVVINTWDRKQVAFVRGNACVLGNVTHVEESGRHDDRQTIAVEWREDLCYFAERHIQKSSLVFRAPAARVLEGDILVLLQGALKPTIVRLCEEHTAIVSTSVEISATTTIPKHPLRKLKPEEEPTTTLDWAQCLPTLTDFLQHVFLVWDWHLSQFKEWNSTCPYHKYEYECSLSSPNSPRAGVCAEPRWEDCVEKAMRLWGLAQLQFNKKQSLEHYRPYSEEDTDSDSWGYPEDVLQNSLTHYKMALDSVHGSGGDHQAWNCLLHRGVDQQAAMSLAAWSGHEGGVKLLLDQGCVPKKDIFGRTQLLWAVMGGEEAIVKLILDCGMDVDTQDVFHYTALLWAADVGNVFVVQLLLDRGTDIELKNNVGRSALFLAAAAGHVAIVKLLLDKGANVHTVDFLGSTPLLATALCGYKPQFYFNFIGTKSSVHAKNDLSVALPRATASEYVEAARLLLDEGANIEAKDRDQRTPLDLASRRGHTALIELLIDRGADIQGTKYHRSTPLIHAITGRHQAAVQLLLDKGADVLVKKAGVKTTLDATVLDAAGAAGDEKIMKLLLDRGAEQFPDIQGGDASYCALRSAAWNGHQAVMQLLLDRGTDINALDSRGNLLLAVAAECNGADAVQRLLDKGADIDATNGKGKTPLLEAIMIGYDDLGDHSTSHHKVIHLLLDRGANVNVKDKYGTSPLLAAIQAGDKAIVEVLLRKGAHIESKGYGGQTPLIRAVENGDKEIVQLLLDKGANVDPKDDAAIKGGKEDVVLCGGVTARGTWRLGPVGRGSGYAGGGAW